MSSAVSILVLQGFRVSWMKTAGFPFFFSTFGTVISTVPTCQPSFLLDSPMCLCVHMRYASQCTPTSVFSLSYLLHTCPFLHKNLSLTSSFSPIPHEHRVNLGGLFVLEPFISPALYQPFNGSAMDEWTLSTLLGDQLQSTLEEHYQTFITEEDIAQIAGMCSFSIFLSLDRWVFEFWHFHFVCSMLRRFYGLCLLSSLLGIQTLPFLSSLPSPLQVIYSHWIGRTNWSFGFWHL